MVPEANNVNGALIQKLTITQFITVALFTVATFPRTQELLQVFRNFIHKTVCIKVSYVGDIRNL